MHRCAPSCDTEDVLFLHVVCQSYTCRVRVLHIKSKVLKNIKRSKLEKIPISTFTKQKVPVFGLVFWLRTANLFAFLPIGFSEFLPGLEELGLKSEAKDWSARAPSKSRAAMICLMSFDQAGPRCRSLRNKCFVSK